MDVPEFGKVAQNGKRTQLVALIRWIWKPLSKEQKGLAAIHQKTPFATVTNEYGINQVALQ
ncbi:hypothetical protein CCP1ISM_2730001 [Azospirillaceae bacterium]